MQLKHLLQMEQYFWALILLVLLGLSFFIGRTEMKALQELAIYGCDNMLLDLDQCPEDERHVAGYEVDHKYNFMVDRVTGDVFDPYGNYAKKQKRIKGLIAAIIILGLYAIVRGYFKIKKLPNDHPIKKLFREKKHEETHNRS